MTNEAVLSPDETMKVGAIAASRIEAAAERNLNEIGRTSNWLTASLLAINGGGVIAAMNVADRLERPVIVGALFILGIIFALLNAVVIQGLANSLQGPIEIWLGYWRSVERYGERDLEAETSMTSTINIIERWKWIAPALGWVSGVVFVISVVVVGATLHQPVPADPSVCALFKREMMSPKPQVRDAPASYTALGCQRL